MLLLTTTSLPTTLEWRAGHPAGAHLGRLLTPRHYSRADDTAAAGVPWAADNDGFNGVDYPAFERMLDALAGVPGALFVTSPDVFGDGRRTLAELERWAPVIRQAGHPAALVTQPGIDDVDAVPWELVDALFVGGEDRYRYGPGPRRIVAEARRRRLHVHVGRVNSVRRIAWAAELDAGSVDGTKYARWRDTRLGLGLSAVANAAAARPLALELDV